MNWYSRWLSRREESRGRLNARPFLFPVMALVGIPIGLVLVGLGWVAANCYTYTVDHDTTVVDKQHEVYYTQRCTFRDDEGNCYAYTHDRHDRYALIMADGHWEYVHEGQYNAVPVGQSYTYHTTHFACR